MWGGSFLADGGIGLKDFASTIVIHEAEGLAALVTAFFSQPQ